jgi:acyl-CoA reductase-like NAD-dependent aldehyde dehydrogenase
MRVDLFIGGKWVPAKRYLTVEMPYDGSPVGEAPRADEAEVAAAVAAAKAAKADAAGRTAYERYQWLTKAAAVLLERRDALAPVLASESGKPLREARTEVERSAQTLVWSAEEAKRIHGEVWSVDAHPVGRGRFGMTLRRPRGVIAAVTPFNFPLNLVCHKVGPALAAGNTVVLKPAEKTPLIAHKFAEVIAAAGVPDGYFNVVCGLGTEIGAFLAGHPDVDMLTFTGSGAVGRILRAAAGVKPVTLELGGNSAVIIDADADLDLALERAKIGGFSNSGQVCIHLQRAYVDESRAEEFRARLAASASAMKVGHPLDDSAEVTSLITPTAAARVDGWVREAVSAGARLLTGGGRSGRATVAPTVLADTPPEARVVSDEIFGPVVTVHGFRGLEQAIEQANRGRLGLHAGIFTRDLDKALYAAERLEAGGVMINDVPTFRVDQMPYGGTKESGIGREGPKYAIEEMTDLRAVVINRGRR